MAKVSRTEQVHIWYVVNDDTATAIANLRIPTVREGEQVLDIQTGGSALRHRTDKPNDDIGTLLATGRALEKLGAKLVNRAEGLVKHADDMREYRKKQLEERDAEGAHPPKNNGRSKKKRGLFGLRKKR